MTVRVRFFASLAERLGVSDQQLSLEPCATVAEVWRHVVGEVPPPQNVLVAVNLEYVDFSAPVTDGDEVAFFPPVTGG